LSVHIYLYFILVKTRLTLCIMLESFDPYTKLLDVLIEIIL